MSKYSRKCMNRMKNYRINAAELQKVDKAI